MTSSWKPSNFLVHRFLFTARSRIYELQNPSGKLFSYSFREKFRQSLKTILSRIESQLNLHYLQHPQVIKTNPHFVLLKCKCCQMLPQHLLVACTSNSNPLLKPPVHMLPKRGANTHIIFWAFHDDPLFFPERNPSI